MSDSYLRYFQNPYQKKKKMKERKGKRREIRRKEERKQCPPALRQTPGLTLHAARSWSSNNHMPFIYLPSFEETETRRGWVTYPTTSGDIEAQFYLLGQSDLFSAGHWPVQVACHTASLGLSNQPVICMQSSVDWGRGGLGSWELLQVGNLQPDKLSSSSLRPGYNWPTGA